MLLSSHGDWRTKYYKVRVVSFFYRKSLTRNKYTINKEDKPIKKKYFLSNTKRVI